MLINIVVDLYLFSTQTSQYSCPFISSIPSFNARLSIFKNLTFFQIILVGMFDKYNINWELLPSIALKCLDHLMIAWEENTNLFHMKWLNE